MLFYKGKPWHWMSGSKLLLTKPVLRCIIDSHMHIENGACTPLPLLWDKSRFMRGKTREQINQSATEGIKGWVASFVIGSAGYLQIRSTVEIGTIAVEENNSAYAIGGPVRKSEYYMNSELMTPMIVMPMDMDYAHIAGYDGQTIYHDDEFPWYFYKREKGAAIESAGEKTRLPEENLKTFCNWKKQYKDTLEAVKSHPFQLIPLYHYEPRRWRGEKGTKLEKTNWLYGPWDFPFKELATRETGGLFIGFKMYTALGYQPLDPHLRKLWDYNNKTNECYYGKCEKLGIPILVHCSPGGMTTHEMGFYRENLQYRESLVRIYNLNTKSFHRTSTISKLQTYGNNRIVWETKEDGSVCVTAYTGKDDLEYFQEHFVHPKQWRRVLEKFPDLKLCLAHFGGDEWQNGLASDWITEIISLMKDYPNFYSDFSCHNFKKTSQIFAKVIKDESYAHILDRILFGTDWYMTLLALGGKGYSKFCEEYWKLFTDIDIKLWLKFSFINPFEFYGFNDKNKLKNFNETLKNELKDGKLQDKRKAYYDAFERLIEEYNRLKERMG